MATLEREKSPTFYEQDVVDITNGIPTPFPVQLAQQLSEQRSTTSLEIIKPAVVEPQQAEGSISDASSSKYPRLSVDVSQKHLNVMEQEIGPTLAQVEQSCIMTLNNLLANNAGDWQPILPTRRHSMPAQSPTVKSSFQTNIPSSALHTLVQNISNCYGPQQEILYSEDKSSLLEQLSMRITALIDSSSIQPHDASLIQALLSLLIHISRISNLSSDVSHPTPIDFSHPLSTSDLYDTLRRQVLELQSHRGIQSDNIYRPPIETVGQAILWHKIDDDLEEVFRLCRERTEVAPVPYTNADSTLPPEYEIGDYSPPIYVPADYSGSEIAINTPSKLNKTGISSGTSSQGLNSSMDEKMRLDFEAITMAIDRLYMVAPQLLNQRVELNHSKLEQMERARLASENAPQRKGKAKEIVRDRLTKKEDIQELEKMLDLINRSSSRRLFGQSVILDSQQAMEERLEKIRLRDIRKRDEFHAHLVSHSNSRRLISQDAELRKIDSDASTRPRIKNPNALLTLPEFIKESLPENIEQTKDPQTLLTLPEFVKEPPPADIVSEESNTSPTSFIKKSFSSRSRSLSAPPISLARLLSGSNISMKPPLTRENSNSDSQANGAQKGKKFFPSQLSMSHQSNIAPAGLDIQYVSEYHDTLGSVAVFLDVNGMEAGANVEAEVFPGDRLIIKCGTRVSAPLALPAKVKPGKRDVRVQSGHFEMKLECPATSSLTNGFTSYYSDDDIAGGLLDATQLKDLNPTSFICASCSLPLVQGATISRYNDLPSQHWAELLEAWMCHSDQKMTDRVSLYANGLWPLPGQALVGGSYILFESGSLVASNIRNNDTMTVSLSYVSIFQLYAGLEEGPRWFVVHQRWLFRCGSGMDEIFPGTQLDHQEDWQPARCICGAIVGRCIQRVTAENDKSTTYRLAKYSIRPVSLSSDPMKIPLSAFILQDIDEFVQAHATYRFVLSDEEEEKPRILIWVFKPHMRISYSTSSHKFLSRTASILAAKVHFKILGPSVSPTIKSTTEKYPEFTQSERLVYPMDVCRRIAALLKESNAAYPQGRRIMGGLDVGWLVRS